MPSFRKIRGALQSIDATRSVDGWKRAVDRRYHRARRSKPGNAESHQAFVDRVRPYIRLQLHSAQKAGKDAFSVPQKAQTECSLPADTRNRDSCGLHIWRYRAAPPHAKVPAASLLNGLLGGQRSTRTILTRSRPLSRLPGGQPRILASVSSLEPLSRLLGGQRTGLRRGCVVWLLSRLLGSQLLKIFRLPLFTLLSRLLGGQRSRTKDSRSFPF